MWYQSLIPPDSMLSFRHLLLRPLIKLIPSIAFCLTLLIVSLSGNPMASSTSVRHTPDLTREIRGVWLTNIDSDVLFKQEHLSDALKKLATLNFNTVYPTVWNFGYTLYPSTVAEETLGRAIDPRPLAQGLRDRDMLATTLAQAHMLGMSVIPWFEFGFMAPADSELANRHPDWLTMQKDGNPVWLQGDEARVWLNPFKPEVQQFIQDLVLEIVGKYNVDGIQFDDHFGLPVEFGYDPYTLKLYQQDHPEKPMPPAPNDPDWVRWRADKLTAFMKQLFHAIKARKSWVLVALSPNPQPFAYESYLQDWSTWVNEGIVEELVVQVYRQDWPKFVDDLNHPSLQAARKQVPTGIGILAGLRNRPIPLRQIQEQVQEVRKQEFAGVSFFFYETLWNLTDESSDRRQSAFQAIFDTPITRPNVVQGWVPPDI